VSSLLTSAKNRGEFLAPLSYRFNPEEISPANPGTEGWVDHGVTLTEAGEQKIPRACGLSQHET